MERALLHVEAGIFAVLGTVAVVRWWQARGRARGWIAFTFMDLATVAIAGELLGPHPRGTLSLFTQRMLVVLVALFPLLLYGFTRTFFRRPAWLDRVAIGLTIAVALGVFAFRKLPAEGERWPSGYFAYVAAFLLQWVLLCGVVGAQLWRAGADQPTVSRRRMRMLSLGAVGLALALVIAGAASARGKSTPALIVADLVAILSGPLFLIGFAPPRVVLASWRRPELDELHNAQAALVASQSPEEVGRRLLPHVARIIGGRGAALFGGDDTLIGSCGLSDEEIAEMARDRLGSAKASLVRIALDEGELLVAGTAYTPYFARDETELLWKLATLTDLALSRAELAEHQRRTVEELRSSNDAMRDFMAIASHDLRTPLTVIKGFAAMLDDELDDEQRADVAARITRQADYLGVIVDDLLLSSKIDAGALTARREEIELDGVVRDVANDLAMPVACTIPRGLRCWADPDHLRRMLTNYLQNASTYGAPPFSVEARHVGRAVEIRVIDAGPGLPEDFAPRAFEKFARADRRASKPRAGSGLGLAIVRGLVRLEGGDAWYEPIRSPGACFVLRLPDVASE